MTSNDQSLITPKADWIESTFDPFDERAELLPGLKVFFEKLIEENSDSFYSLINTDNAAEQEVMIWQTVNVMKNTGKTFSKLALSPDNPGIANNRAALNSLIKDGLFIVDSDKTKVSPTPKLIFKLMARYPETAPAVNIGALPSENLSLNGQK